MGLLAKNTEIICHQIHGVGTGIIEYSNPL